ncbi:ABC transporter ATP-binding protein [Salinigranum rubrum]|uniref:Cobalamin import ATP-binding protein BtuD n=1 Tax=Salinigranum rubrum TaxID=755307 RepID=A0A2I8VFF9_9EURY|nr:ABC transporter ATP-binding protein [Salinigranum rubrum]AUV80668.1 ABC transporter ATP-binding protein [Salinigranum rubrum]
MTDERTTRPDGGAGSAVERERAARDDRRPTEDTDSSASEFVGEELVISYPSTSAPVIDGESLRVPPGAVTALVGPNGSGKSTLLKGLADQLGLDAGTVRLDGTDISTLGAKKIARKLGLLSQENTSPGSISVEKLVEHGRYPHRGFFDGLSETDREAIDRAISLAGVEHLRDREVGSLSGGQKQLVWIAMALAQETDVLLLDEPTTFLDLHHQLEVMDIVETLRDESDITVVLVLHDIDQAARYADHMVALKDGTIHARGAPEEVVTQELLAEVFEIDAEVEHTDRGPRIEPLRARHDDDSRGAGDEE